MTTDNRIKRNAKLRLREKSAQIASLKILVRSLTAENNNLKKKLARIEREAAS